MNKNLCFDYILLALLVIISVMLIGGTYLFAFHENPPIEFFNQPFPVTKESYSGGETVVVTVQYCKHTTSAYIRNLSFVDGLVFSIPESRRGGATLGCDTVDVSSVTIPETLPPGNYYLRGKNEYEVNFLATRVVEWTSEVFEVIP